MTDSFEDLEPPDPRSILYRVVEGLTVVALLVAVVMWQSDGTLQAARQLVAGGDAEPAAAPVMMALQPRSTDIRLLPSLAADAGRSGEVDPVETGSIQTPPPAPLPAPILMSPPGAAPAAPLAVAPMPTRVAARPPPSVPAQPPVGWVAACDTAEGSFCTASQTLSQPDDPLVETSWTIERSKGGLYGVWTTPTAVIVARGMVLTLGDGRPKAIPFSSCGAHSCEIRARLAGDFVDLLRRAPRVSTEIVLKNGKTVSFQFSKEGLAEALAKLGV